MAYRKLPRKRTPAEILEVKKAWYVRTYEPKPKNPPCSVGDVFNRLTVIEVYESTGGRYRVKCECVCGGVIDERPSYVIPGRVKSCGCLQREYRRNENNMRFGGYHG